jgi:predicted transcriptional regulator
MTNEMVDRHLTSEIVAGYVRHHRIETDQVPELITSVHRALCQLGQPEQPEEVLTPAVSIRQSVRPDYVVCLDCGYRAMMLLRHITKQHGLSREEYLKRWGLRVDHPLTAPGYSERRSTLAKSLGFGRKPNTQADTAMPPTASPPAHAKPDATSTRGRRSRSTSKRADVASEAVSQPTRVRRKASRSRT